MVSLKTQNCILFTCVLHSLHLQQTGRCLSILSFNPLLFAEHLLCAHVLAAGDGGVNEAGKLLWATDTQSNRDEVISYMVRTWRK